MAKMAKPIIRFDEHKLRAFAEALGRSQSDIMDALAYSIITGRAPAHVAALQAGPYDDFIGYRVDNITPQMETFIITADMKASRTYHELDWQLGAATFISPTDSFRAIRRAVTYRVFLCFGHEYLDPDRIEALSTHKRKPVVCHHILEEDSQMPKVTAPRIWWDEASGAYACATPYNETFVNFIKIVSKQDKKWDAEEKLWYFSPQAIQNVRAEVERIFGTCHFTGPTAAPRVSASVGSDVFSRFGRLVGIDNMAKAYRGAATHYHTDRGGDHDKMSELNALWAEIKAVLK